MANSDACFLLSDKELLRVLSLGRRDVAANVVTRRVERQLYCVCCFKTWHCEIIEGVSFLDFLLVLSVDVLHLHQVWVKDKFIVASLCLDLSILHDNDVVSEVNEVDCVSDENSCLSLHQTDEDLVKDSLANVAVKG